MNDFKCLSECRSPRSCGDFGYCRERNFDGYPQDQANINRRRRESETEKVGERGEKK